MNQVEFKLKFSMERIQKRLGEFPIEVRYHPDKGRHIVALVDIPADSLIFRVDGKRLSPDH